MDGRGFEDRDAQPPADVVVINRSLATRLFGNEYPIGRWIRVSPRAPTQSVIGVVNDANKRPHAIVPWASSIVRCVASITWFSPCAPQAPHPTRRP